MRGEKGRVRVGLRLVLRHPQRSPGGVELEKEGGEGGERWERGR